MSDALRMKEAKIMSTLCVTANPMSSETDQSDRGKQDNKSQASTHTNVLLRQCGQVNLGSRQIDAFLTAKLASCDGLN